jgi:hypothetical protein
MSDRDDELDPSDWLAAQFGEEPAAPVAPTPVTPPAAVPPAAEPPFEPSAPLWPTSPAAPAPVEPPLWPSANAPAPAAPEPPLWPTEGLPASPAPPAPWPGTDSTTPAVPVAASVPPAQQPQYPPVAEPVFPSTPEFPPTPASAPAPDYSAPPAQAAPPAPAAPAPAAEPGGFAWGLTPGADPAVVAATPPPLIPPVVAPPVASPVVTPPVSAPPVAAPPLAPPAPPVAAPPVAPEPTVVLPAAPVPTAPPLVEPPAPAASVSDFDQPTQAMPVVGGALEPRELDPSSWFSTPVDADLGGVTEVIEAEIIGLPTPDGEGLAAESLEQTSGLDSLFGETAFQEYDDTIVSAPPPRAPGGGAAPPAGPKPPAAPIPRVQKILMIVAGSLVGVLALVALFVVGMRLSDSILPTPVASPTPTPTPTVEPILLGPVPPGEYRWDELLGGECLGTWEGAWTETFEVVDCAGSHPAQLVGRGVFEEANFDPYPGFDVLLGRMNTLCTAPTVIDYAVANQFPDLQIASTIPVDDADWDAGNRSWFCFVTRSSGADLTGTIAVPAVLPTPTPTPSAVPSTADPTAAPGGRGSGSAPPKG